MEASDPYGHQRYTPTVEVVLADIAWWEDIARRLTEVVAQAKEKKKEQEDAKKNVNGWVYTSCSSKDTECNNEQCPHTAKGYYFNEEKDAFVCDACFPIRDEIVRNLRLYETETWKDKAKRAGNEDEWYFIRVENDRHVCIEDINCLFKRDTCWFDGNRDRLDEYDGSYILLGTDKQIGICSICWNNSGIHDRAVEDAIKDEFQTAEEKCQEKQEKYEQGLRVHTSALSVLTNWQTKYPSSKEESKCIFGHPIRHHWQQVVTYKEYNLHWIKLCNDCWEKGRYKDPRLAQYIAQRLARR